MNPTKALRPHRGYTVVALFVIALLLIAGCGQGNADAPATTTPEGTPPTTATSETMDPPTATPEVPETVSPLTNEMLANATYSGIYTYTVQLEDGSYAGEPFVAGGASRPTVTLTDLAAFGDLDGDGVDDAVVVLVENSGGSGSFFYLAVVLNRDGSPENVATHLIGDRVQIESIVLDGASIALDAVVHGPDDPLCCPSQAVTLTFRLEGETLIATSGGESMAAATPTELAGTTWTLVSYVDATGATVSVLSGTEITAEFIADQILGRAGCNGYFAPYELDGTAVTIGPGGTTRMACSEPEGIMAQESDYLAMLETAATYQVEGDTLTLRDAAGAPVASFSRASNSEGADTDGEMDAISPVSADQIIDITWQWVELLETEPVAQSIVPDPENYTLLLRADGTYELQADCNRASGTYVLEGSSLTLQPGPTTLAACGPDSLSDLYLTTLAKVVSVSHEEGRLVLHLRDNAGTIVFDFGRG